MDNNIIGQKVVHKVFGEGKILETTNNIIKIHFELGEKSFVFPDAFELYLRAIDKEFRSYMQILKLQKKEEKRKQEENKRIEKESELINFRTDKNIVVKKRGIKEVQRKNIAFKCNYCDGGKSKHQVGYISACSDEIIHNNIVIENKTWCSSEESPCYHYYYKKTTRDELDSYCSTGGFVCYESQMLREWKAYAGIVQRGDRKGEPMRLNKVQHNSLCVLTTRNPNMNESERYIFAVFLVDETYAGDKCDEGYVGTRSKYRIKLSPTEGKNMLFWKYHKNSNSPEKPAWNSGLHRYFEDEMAAQILRDIVDIKKGTEDESLAKDFLNHFCDINEIDIIKVNKPSGALIL